MREIVPPAELGQPVCYAVRVHWLSVILSKQKALFSVILTQPQPLRVLPCPVLPKELHRFRWQRNPTIRSRGFWRILIYAYMFRTIRDVARYLKIPESFVRRLVAQGVCPGVYSGNRFLVNVEALREYLDEESRKA